MSVEAGGSELLTSVPSPEPSVTCPRPIQEKGRERGMRVGAAQTYGCRHGCSGDRCSYAMVWT